MAVTSIQFIFDFIDTFRYFSLLDSLLPMVCDAANYRLVALAALFRYPEEFGAGCGAAEAAGRKYRELLGQRGLLTDFEQAMPMLEELAEIMRIMTPNI